MVNSRVSTPLLRSFTRRTTPQQRFLSLPIFATTPRHSSPFSSSSSAAHNNSNNNNTPTNSNSNPNPNQSNTDWRAMAEKDITNYLRETHDRVFEHNRCWAEQKRAS